MSSAVDLRQSKHRQKLMPFLLDRVPELGVVGLRSKLVLHLETTVQHDLAPLIFTVDTGCSVTIISMDLALSRGLPVSQSGEVISLEVRTTAGLVPMRVSPGRIRVRWNPDHSGYPFDWPVFFRIGTPVGSPSLLGLGGVIHTCKWTFDGSYSIDSPYGFLPLDDIR